MTRHQFFSFSLAGKGGSFPSKTSDSLGTDHSARTRIKSWHSASRLKARLQWFWFQTKEICMASSLFNTQLLKKSLKVATLRWMKLHYWGNRLRSLRFVCVFHCRTPNPFMAPLLTLKPFLTKKQLFFHLHQSWIKCLSGVSFWSTPWALSNSLAFLSGFLKKKKRKNLHIPVLITGSTHAKQPRQYFTENNKK